MILPYFLLAAPALSAHLLIDKMGETYVAVSRGKRTWVLKNAWFANVDRASLGSRTPTLNNARFKTDQRRIVNIVTGQSIEAPFDFPKYDGIYEPFLDSVTSLPFGRNVLWLLAWRNGGVMTDPVVSMRIYEVALKNGKLTFLRSAEIPRPCDLPSPRMSLHKDHLLMEIITYEGNRVVSLDLKTWQIQDLAVGKETLLGKSGNAYWIHEGRVDRWMDAGNEWRTLTRWSPQGDVRAVLLGKDDLLVSEDGMFNTKTLAYYRFPQDVRISRNRPNLYVHPNLGIGVVYGKSTPEADVWLDHRTFRPICPITGRVRQPAGRS